MDVNEFYFYSHVMNELFQPFIFPLSVSMRVTKSYTISK